MLSAVVPKGIDMLFVYILGIRYAAAEVKVKLCEYATSPTVAFTVITAVPQQSTS